MYYLVSVDHNGMAVYLTRSGCSVMICCGMAVNRMAMLGQSVRKMKVLTVKIETETQSGKGRWNQI